MRLTSEHPRTAWICAASLFTGPVFFACGTQQSMSATSGETGTFGETAGDSVEPTTGTSSSSDPSDSEGGTTVGSSTGGLTTSSTSGYDDSDITRFRAGLLDVLDPHLFDVECTADITPAINAYIGNALKSDTSPQDGLYDLSLLFDLGDLQFVEGHAGYSRTGTAYCEVDSQACYWDDYFITGYEMRLDGHCATPDGAVLTYGEISATPAPCYRVDVATLLLDLSGLLIPLQETTVAARVNDRKSALVDGLLIGFLSQEAANEAKFPESTPFVGGRFLSEFLCKPGDRDTLRGVPGWWVFLGFEAEIWPTEVMP